MSTSSASNRIEDHKSAKYQDWAPKRQNCDDEKLRDIVGLNVYLILRRVIGNVIELIDYYFISGH